MRVHSGSTDANAPGLPLACQHARPMGRRGLSCDREEFSPHHGLQRSLGPESDLAWREGYESEGSGVKCLCRLPPSTKFGSPSKDSRVQSVVPENAAQIWDD